MSSKQVLNGILRLYNAGTILHLHDDTIELTDQSVRYTAQIYNTDQLFHMFHLYRQMDYPALKHQFKRYKAKEIRDTASARNTQPVTMAALNWTFANDGYTLKITDHSIGMLYTDCASVITKLDFPKPPTIGAIHRTLFLFSIRQYDQIVFTFHS